LVKSIDKLTAQLFIDKSISKFKKTYYYR